MRYFKAVEINFKPFLFWNGVASSLKQLEQLELDNDPLILPETEVPATIYGVCPLKIEGGVLVERTAPEMAAFQVEFDIRKAMLANIQKIDAVAEGSFIFDGKTFPMDEVSRLYYHSMPTIATDHRVMTVEAELYILALANVSNFMTAYLTALYNLTKHTI